MANYDEQIDTISEINVEEPGRYKVLLHNDNITTVEFVIAILEQIFHKSHDEAVKITYYIDRNGIGECGIYLLEIAETKVGQVRNEARLAGFPLQCSIEKV